MTQTEKQTKAYQAPAVKVVVFKVEDGFASITDSGTAEEGLINFGVDRDHGLMNHGEGDHSGLGQYQEGGSIFGDRF